MATFLGLFNSIVLLLALGVIYDALSANRVKDAKIRRVLTGLIIGTLGMMLMLTSWEYKPGVFFDTRWVLISLSAVFFGRTSTFIAVIMMVGLRVFQGGEGVYVGCWLIISSALLGTLFNTLSKRYAIAINGKSLYVFALLIEINVIISLLMLPDELAWPVIESLAPTLLIFFPIASTLLGILLLHQQTRWHNAKQLVESQRLLDQERGILKGIIDSVPDLIFYKSTDGKYLGCNKAFEEFVGLSEAKIVGQRDCELFTQEAADAFVEQDKLTLAGNQSKTNEEWVQYPDGRRALLDTLKTPFYVQGDKVQGLVGISRDCTQRYYENAKLRESELTYRSIIRTAIDGFWIVSLESVIEEVNQAYIEMSGYTRDELCGIRVNTLDIHHDESKIQELIGELIQGNKQVYQSQHRRKDGSLFDVEVNVTYWDGESGGKFFAFIRDITERKTAQEQLLQSERRFRMVFESIPKIAVQGYDKNREVIFWNKASELTYGYTQKQALGKKLEDLIIPDVARDTVISEVNEWLRGGEVTPASELVLEDADKKPVTVFSTHVMIQGINDEREMYCIDIDLRAQKAAEERATTLSQAIEQSPMSVVITNPDGIIEYVNGTFEQTSGFSAAQILGKPIKRFRAKATDNEVYQEMAQALQLAQPWQGEFESKRRDGQVYWEQAHVAPVTGLHKEVTHYIAVTTDITQQKEQELKILHQAHFDNLTALPNRFLALDRLGQMLAEARRSGHNVAILFLDFDDFKKVNDSLGHHLGDELLIEAAKRLKMVVRESDVVGRLGGDEFIVIVKQEHESTSAAVVADKLLEQFRKPFVLDGRELVSTVSIGIAIYPEDGKTANELLRQADSAMYHSKGGGRDTYNFYTEQMNLDVARRVLIEEQLRLALIHNELSLNYQPLFNLAEQKIIGAEALIRWSNPELGNVGPDEFIPIAEQTGLIVEIGLYVVREAIKQIALWRLKYDENLRIAINVSPMQFRDKVLQKEIFVLLEQYQLPCSAIELEITEGVLVSGFSTVEESLNTFHEAGVGIAMDDFGTGYSSLSYLRNYPFDTIKIDKSFVQDITSDNADLELVSAAISMGHGLHLNVVAEGVETQEQLKVLVGLNCDIGQGYLFGRPLLASEFEQVHLSS